MRRFGRRRFIGGSVAAVCVGCASNDAPSLRPPSTGTGSPPGPLSTVEVGTLAEVSTATADQPLYVAEAKAWLVALDDDEAAALAEVADVALRPGLELGLLALYEKCPHLGCRVPYCSSSEWFECACHGAHFTRLGEHRAGPGPRGLDALPIVVDGEIVRIGQTERVAGPPVGTELIDQPAAGPHCVDAGGR